MADHGGCSEVVVFLAVRGEGCDCRQLFPDGPTGHCKIVLRGRYLAYLHEELAPSMPRELITILGDVLDGIGHEAETLPFEPCP